MYIMSLLNQKTSKANLGRITKKKCWIDKNEVWYSSLCFIHLTRVWRTANTRKRRRSVSDGHCQSWLTAIMRPCRVFMSTPHGLNICANCDERSHFCVNTGNCSSLSLNSVFSKHKLQRSPKNRQQDIGRCQKNAPVHQEIPHTKRGLQHLHPSWPITTKRRGGEDWDRPLKL